MAGYLVVTINNISDLEKLREYRVAAGPSVQKYGGELIIGSSAEQRHLEGEKSQGIVVFRFPSYAAALAWYDCPEYRETKKIRAGIADVTMVIADGAD